MRKRIKEGVERGDLQSLVSNRVSIAEFEPKIGTAADVTVIGFYAVDDAPANDLAHFIETGTTKVLDTEVSPNPDDSGLYLVFVEVKNNEEMMKTIFEILDDIAPLCNITKWKLKFYRGKEIEISEDQVRQWLKKKQ